MYTPLNYCAADEIRTWTPITLGCTLEYFNRDKDIKTITVEKTNGLTVEVGNKGSELNRTCSFC